MAGKLLVDSDAQQGRGVSADVDMDVLDELVGGGSRERGREVINSLHADGCERQHSVAAL
jgi:hypothetical protein